MYLKKNQLELRSRFKNGDVISDRGELYVVLGKLRSGNLKLLFIRGLLYVMQDVPASDRPPLSEIIKQYTHYKTSYHGVVKVAESELEFFEIKDIVDQVRNLINSQHYG